MPFANREVNRLGVPVFRLAQAGITREQPPQRRRVSGRGGSDRVPEVAFFVRFQFAWLDHSEPYFGALVTGRTSAETQLPATTEQSGQELAGALKRFRSA
jgi:hypothetical protein